jgi:hypothetical protein
MGSSAPEHNDQRERWTVVTAVDGQTLTLKYKDGEKKIFVPANTPIVVYVQGDKSDLKPGAKVFIAAIKQPDGTLQGRAWRVGRDGVTPPMWSRREQKVWSEELFAVPPTLLTIANEGPNLPTYQSKFDLVINLVTARALGLTVPADPARPRRQVIE